MNIYGQLENAQLENRVANYSAGVVGRVWLNTAESKIYVEREASIIRSFLLNDDKLIVGTNGTPANNVRIARGANSRLQLLKGDDVTAEGTMGTTLAELAYIPERYTDAGKPAATVANAGRVIYITDLNKHQFNNASGAWIDLDAGGGGGGGSSAYRFAVNGLLSILGQTAVGFPKKRLDGAAIPGTFTPTGLKVGLEKAGGAGSLILDVRASQNVNVPVIGVDAQYQARVGLISNIAPAQATQSISRAASQISTQSITRPKAAITIDRIVIEDGQMRVILTGPIDSDWAVGDSVLIANSANTANNGTFPIVQLGSVLYPNSLLLTNVAAVAERYSGGGDQTAYLLNIGTGSNAIVTSQYVYPDGRVILGGTFTTWNGVARNRIIRLNTDGTPDTAFNTNTGTAFSVAASDINSIQVDSTGKIVIGGIFTTYNGNTRNRLVRLNSDGTEDTAFYTNLGTAFGGNVWGVCVQADDKIVVSGAFTTFNALTRNRLLRLNSDGTEDTAFYTNLGTALSTATNGALVIRQQADLKLLLGGDFTALNATTRNRMIRLNADGTEDTAFYTNLGTAFGAQVNGIAVQADGKIVVGGSFTTLGANTRNYIVRLNSDGTEDSAFYFNFGVALNALVTDVTVRAADQKIFVAGNFTTGAGQTLNRIVVLGPSGNPDIDWLAQTGTGFSAQTYQIRHDSNGDVYVCGSFAAYQTSTSLDFVKIKENGVLRKGNVTLHLYSYNFASPVDAQFVPGELFLSAAHTTGANNGNKLIYKVNEGGNNIWHKSATGVLQAAPAGTADVFRWSYNLGALPAADFAVGEDLKAASHSTAANNGNFPIRALTATAIIVYNVAGVLQAGVAGTCNTNRWQYEVSVDPSTDSALAANDLVRFANCPVVANNGNFTVREINRGGGSNRNIVVSNNTGAAQTTGGVGDAISEKKVLKFSADQSAIFTTNSYVELQYMEDANYNAETKVYKVEEVNRGGGANYNIVLKEIAANRQVTVQGQVSVESRSLTTTPITIAALPVSSADGRRAYTQDFSGLLTGSAVAANKYVGIWILQNFTDAIAVDLSVTLS
jgi:uncharacterized delta-60 repeat protein